MGFDHIYNQYRRELEFIEQYLMNFAESIPEESSKKLVKYFLEKKGHRLRPILCLMAYECAGGQLTKVGALLEEEQELFKLSTSLELLHSASLLHDDVIDQEKLRRGQKSVNSLKGNKIAVLIGNIFYLNAFKLVVNPEDMKYYEKMLSTSLNMCQGEVLQSEKMEKLLTIEEYFDIIEKKTGELIELSCYFGAAAAKAEEKVIEKISRIGSILGLFYQIRDDRKDSDVHLENEKELIEICEKMHQEFLVLTNELQDNARFDMRKFIEFESIVRP